MREALGPAGAQREQAFLGRRWETAAAPERRHLVLSSKELVQVWQAETVDTGRIFQGEDSAVTRAQRCDVTRVLGSGEALWSACKAYGGECLEMRRLVLGKVSSGPWMLRGRKELFILLAVLAVGSPF